MCCHDRTLHERPLQDLRDLPRQQGQGVLFLATTPRPPCSPGRRCTFGEARAPCMARARLPEACGRRSRRRTRGWPSPRVGESRPTTGAWNVKQFVTREALCELPVRRMGAMRAPRGRTTPGPSNWGWMPEPALPDGPPDVNALPILRRGAEGAARWSGCSVSSTGGSRASAQAADRGREARPTHPSRGTSIPGEQRRQLRLAAPRRRCGGRADLGRAPPGRGGSTRSRSPPHRPRRRSPPHGGRRCPTPALAASRAGSPRSRWQSGRLRRARVRSAATTSGQTSTSTSMTSLSRRRAGAQGSCAGVSSVVARCLSGTRSARGTSSPRHDGRSHGLQVPVDHAPWPGDIVVWKRPGPKGWEGHTGYVHHGDQGRLFTVEGNRTSRVEGFDYPLVGMADLLGFVRLAPRA